MMKYTLRLSAFWLSIFIFTTCGNPARDGNNTTDPDGNAGRSDTLGSAGNPGDSSLIIVMDRMIDQMSKMSLSEHFDVH